MSALDDLAHRLAALTADAGGGGGAGGGARGYAIDAVDAVAARTYDSLGALVAGCGTVEGRAIAASLRGWESELPAAVVRRVASTRMTELDDIHMTSCTTPGSVVVPVAVTLGAALEAHAEDYRRAVAAGYEAMTRLGAAISGPQVVYRGVWPTYFCAPFAAAAVTGTLLGLDAPRLAGALGIALTRATGLTSAIAGELLARWLTVGDAARAGCSAAFAARDGFVAALDLDRIATGAGVEIDPAVLRDDAPPAIEAVSVKPFPTAKQSLAAVEAALALRRGDGRGGAAEGIVVRVPEAYARMIAAAPRPDSRLSRVSSAGWNVALALVAPESLHDVERVRGLEDPELAQVAAGVEVVADGELSRLYPTRWPARVELLGSGRSETVLDTTGDPSCGNGLEAVDAKWRARPEDLQGLREAALAGDIARLTAFLDRHEDRQ
jgi:2-methylcitrate dehydratase PrpD